MIDRLRDLFAVECMVPACSRDPELYVADGSALLLCPTHSVEVAIEVHKGGGSE